MKPDRLREKAQRIGIKEKGESNWEEIQDLMLAVADIKEQMDRIEEALNQ